MLDGRRRPLPVTVAHGTSYLASDPGPRRLRLAPGRTAVAFVAWSNTVTSGDVLAGQFLRVAARAGDHRAVWPVVTDLGTTGKVELTAWAPRAAG